MSSYRLLQSDSQRFRKGIVSHGQWVQTDMPKLYPVLLRLPQRLSVSEAVALIGELEEAVWRVKELEAEKG